MIFRALENAGQKATYTFVINDFDPAMIYYRKLEANMKNISVCLEIGSISRPKFKSLADMFAPTLSKQSKI